ncbi:hypothetical protein C8Q79DRAFT_1002204 [Trametes meyenii]|nr:hypothetical protein C8Q79DRAFT_1002204 [Trametes meyenii]
MHNLFLGELRHHCRDVWGLDVKDKGGDGAKMDPHTPDQQRAYLRRVANGVLKQSRTALRKVRKGYLVAVAEVNGVAPVPSDLFTKDAYIHGLLEWVKSLRPSVVIPPVLNKDVINFYVSEGPQDISKFRVLTRDIVEKIRQDILNTVLPSWMERPPRNFGSPSHGKLKADQWRTACTVNLVITLCRIWGASGASDGERLLLDNFIHLVCAVDLATRHSTDPARIASFDKHMFQYLASLHSLFAHNFVPNHHLSLHLHEFLLLFGLVHAWWAFVFERYNGVLQHLNINNNTRDMPLTFMTYFYVGANARWLMSTSAWPATVEYKNMMQAFQDAFGDISAGTPAAKFVPPNDDVGNFTLPAYEEQKETALSRNVYAALLVLLSTGRSSFSSFFARKQDSGPILHNSVNYIKCLRRDHMTFATPKAARRDSYILFSDPTHSVESEGSFLRAGQINEIFIHARIEQGERIVEPFIVIDEFRPLTGGDSQHDPYRQYPDLHTRMFYNKTYASPRVIRPKYIRCHFAALTTRIDSIKDECIIARSLDRVSQPDGLTNVRIKRLIMTTYRNEFA